MKSELRKQVLHEMKAIPRTQKVTMDLALTDQFLKHPSYQRSQGHRNLSLFPHEFKLRN